MYILTIKGKTKEGAYSVVDSDGDEVLYLFEEKDDAVRYVGQLDALDYPEMVPTKVDDDVMIEACEMHGMKYAIITPEDIIIPPEGPSDII